MRVLKETVVKPAQPAVVEQVLSDVDGEGFTALLGKRVTIFCAAYIYSGVLVGVNTDCVKLAEAGIVYETGAFTTKTWQDYQPFPAPGVWYVQKSAIEGFGILK
jgi:hypothetical protein